jgi:hypothetical protein
LLLAERLARRTQRRTVDDLIGAERLEIGGLLARPVDAMTRQPLSANSEIAIEPTAAAPSPARRPLTAEIMALDRHQRQHGVKPAVPIAIACARVRPVGSLTSQSPFTAPARHSRRNGSRSVRSR